MSARAGHGAGRLEPLMLLLEGGCRSAWTLPAGPTGATPAVQEVQLVDMLSNRLHLHALDDGHPVLLGRRHEPAFTSRGVLTEGLICCCSACRLHSDCIRNSDVAMIQQSCRLCRSRRHDGIRRSMSHAQHACAGMVCSATPQTRADLQWRTRHTWTCSATSSRLGIPPLRSSPASSDQSKATA